MRCWIESLNGWVMWYMLNDLCGCWLCWVVMRCVFCWCGWMELCGWLVGCYMVVGCDCLRFCNFVLRILILVVVR